MVQCNLRDRNDINPGRTALRSASLLLLACAQEDEEKQRRKRITTTVNEGEWGRARKGTNDKTPQWVLVVGCLDVEDVWWGATKAGATQKVQHRQHRRFRRVQRQTFKLTATKLPSSEITRLVDCSNTLTLDVSNAMYNMLPCLNFSFFKVLEEDNG
jgi:hypothetical protein